LQKEVLHTAARTSDVVLVSFMSLSIVTLPTVPALGLTDLRLIDVKTNRLIEVVIGKRKVDFTHEEHSERMWNESGPFHLHNV